MSMAMKNIRQFLGGFAPFLCIHRTTMQIGVLMACAFTAAADPMLPATFEVTTEIEVPADQVKPLGFGGWLNNGPVCWSGNNLIKWGDFEPYSCRLFALVTSVGSDGAVLDDWVPDSKDGFMNGATVRVYRIVDRDGRPLPEAQPDKSGDAYLDLKNADRIEFVGTGTVKEWRMLGSSWRDFASEMVLQDGPDLRPHDAVFVESRFAQPDPELLLPTALEKAKPNRVADRSGWQASDGAPVRFTRVMHDEATKARFGETFRDSCLRVDVSGASEQTIKQTAFGPAKQTFYGQLEPGKNYRLAIWMKAEGLAGGDVVFGLGDAYPSVSHAFTVSERWECHTFDFVGPDVPEKGLGGAQLTITGPGTLWMDNARLFRWDTPEDKEKPFVPNRTILDVIRASQPPAGEKGLARCTGGLWEKSMDSLLSWTWHGDQPYRGNFGMVESLPVALTYMELTGDSPETRMQPMLTLGLFYNEQEWQDLIEYLAVPYDPATDTPESKPYAHRRFTQRGHGNPWTDTFRKFIIEMGNENWHNRKMQEFTGFGRRNAIWQDGLQYGMFCRYLYENSWRKSPYWKQLGLEGKFDLYVTGGYQDGLDKSGVAKGYGPDAVRGAAPQARWCSMGLYVGPKGEVGEQGESTLNDGGYQKCLFGYQVYARHQTRAAGEAHKVMAALEMPYDLLAYETGPTGFIVGPGQGELKQVSEFYGKSKATGVACMDAWLDAPSHGFQWMAYSALNQGTGFSSHTSFGQGLHPTPAWQAMVLRNSEIRGDKVKVTETSLPTMTLVRTNKAKTIRHENQPLVRCYAFRDGDRWMVCLLSLKADGEHDGIDFGDGVTPCSVKLPFSRAQKITLHTLTGGLRDTNLEELKVERVSIDIPATALVDGVLAVNQHAGSPVGGLPPGELLLYVFEETSGYSE